MCSVAAGWLAKSGISIALLLPFVVLFGAAMGSFNGLLVGRLRLPSIIVTLAMLTAWRDGLLWITQGAWVENLPATFQWFGLSQTSGQGLIVTVALVVLIAFSWLLRNLGAGRAIYAVGSDSEAARLAGLGPRRVVFGVFAVTGALVGLAALLNAVRFAAVPGNAGVGLELKTIAAVVVGGAAITGGRGTLAGTLIGVALLGTIGTGVDLYGHQSVLGKGNSGRESYWRRSFPMEHSGAWNNMADSNPLATPLLETDAPWRERLFPNNEWVLLVVLLVECQCSA